jgi:hypothetical protein
MPICSLIFLTPLLPLYASGVLNIRVLNYVLYPKYNRIFPLIAGHTPKYYLLIKSYKEYILDPNMKIISQRELKREEIEEQTK